MIKKLYTNDEYVNPQAGYTLRMNYSFTEDFELHDHDYYEFFLTISGKAVHMVNGKRQLLPEHSLVFIRAKDVHTYIKDGEFSFVNLTFTTETMEKLLDYFGQPLEELLQREMPSMRLLKNSDFKRLLERLNSLNTVRLHDRQNMTLKMKLILTELFCCLLEEQPGQVESAVPGWLGDLVLLLKKPEYIHMTLPDMAKVSGKSKEHISRSFQKYYGVTAAAFMNEQKLNYCANLLLHTNLSVIDICYTCGFQNVSWFYRKFKEMFDLTPKEFRKKAAY